MGKRKLNGATFYQCDWTGFPMKAAHCYMPTWPNDTKLAKKGSYCTWEAVAAHASELLRGEKISQSEYDRVIEHIAHVTGTHVEDAPHYDELAHIKGKLDVRDFHKVCSKHVGPITGVKIAPTGDIFEVVLTPTDGAFDFEHYVHKPYNLLMGLSTFHSMRKKGASRNTERDLGVWYFATKELPPNPTASGLFKMQLYGDVLLVQQSREASFLPRERFVSFSRQQFDELFTKRKRQKVDPPSLTPDAYADLKAEMQESLNSFEQKVSEKAAPPRQMATAQTMGPTSGRTLAAKLEERGVPRPVPVS